MVMQIGIICSNSKDPRVLERSCSSKVRWNKVGISNMKNVNFANNRGAGHITFTASKGQFSFFMQKNIIISLKDHNFRQSHVRQIISLSNLTDQRI